MISLIAAVAENNAIGFENKLLYWLPNDLKRFKTLTSGHTIVMGRKTFESLPKGALPNRRNIMLSRTTQEAIPNTEVFGSLHEAIAHCRPDEEIFIIGGASLYAETLPIADRLYLTHVKDTPTKADAFFPILPINEWRILHEESHQTDEKHAQDYTFTDYARIR
ncbi:MAG: dihydrofolate reductase [Clostridium sp.]|nr:dihydrofolate reductase [Clostridium sp.]